MFKQLFLSLFLITAVCSAREYTGPKNIREIDRAFDIYADSLSQKYGMPILATSISSGLIPFDTYSMMFSISFKSSKKLTIEQARPLVAALIQEYAKKIYSDPKWLEYIVYHHPDAKPSMKWVGFKIGFWDENVDRPLYPYLAKIVVSNEKIRYYYADPKTGALIEPPVVDTFPETK